MELYGNKNVRSLGKFDICSTVTIRIKGLTYQGQYAVQIFLYPKGNELETDTIDHDRLLGPYPVIIMFRKAAILIVQIRHNETR